MESFAGWPSLEGQEEGPQGVVGSTPLEKGVAGRVDQARSRRRHGGDGSRKLVGMEGSDPRPCEEVGDQGRGGGWRGKKGHGRAYEQTVKKRRACPSRSPPAEIWTMLLHASRNLSPGGQGIGYQRKKIEPVFTLSLVEKLCVEFCPLEQRRWLGTTAPAPLHKSNKAGPKGKSVVHVLPSVGKQFFKVLLRTKRDMWSPPAPADRLHGYIPGRRRESAVLTRQVTTWRLERLGLKSLAAFHDLTNAFGSVKWEAMHRAAARMLGPNCLLGQQRHRLATTTIPGMDGDITLKIGRGGLMGDPLMVALWHFSRRRFAGSMLWQKRVRSQGNCLHGILGRVEGSTFRCRSMPTTQPNRLLLSLGRMSRRWQNG